MQAARRKQVGESLDLLLGPLAALGYCQPDGSFITSLAELREHLAEMVASGEAVCLDGLGPGCNDPGGGATRRCCMTPSATPTPPSVSQCRPSGATCCDAMGLAGVLPRAELIELAGLQGMLDASGVATIVDRGFRGLAKPREHWHAPVGAAPGPLSEEASGHLNHPEHQGARPRGAGARTA